MRPEARPERRNRETGHADVDRFLDRLRDRVRSALGAEFLGMYVVGSLALGGFDVASDVDVVIATTTDVTYRRAALGLVHRELAREPEWFARQLECIYMPQRGLRRFDPAHATYLRLDRGAGATLEIDTMDESWFVTCHVLRTVGIRWDGPDAATLVGPVPPEDLRSAMRGLLAGWAADVQRQPDRLRAPNYQSYAVLTVCRILHTLETRTILSKQSAAEWATAKLPVEWRGLITQAVADRLRDDVLASDVAVARTLDLIEYARSYGSSG